MASKGLGVLTLDLVARIGGFTGPMDQAARTADKRFKQMGDSAERFGRGLGGALKSAAGNLLAFAGVTVGVSAAISGIKDAIDRADALRDLSIRVGASTEALSAFGYAASQTGTNIDELSKGMLILSKNAALALNPKSKQAGLFGALGVSKEELGDIEKLLPKLADQFKLLEDGTQKAALAQQLFGRSGAVLIEFLNQGSDGLKTMGDRARELGIIIDTDTANAADEFNDKLADLKAAAGGFATEIASALLPQLTEIVDWAVDFVKEGGGAEHAVANLKDGFHDLSDAVSSVAGAGSGFISYLGEVRKNIAETEKALGDGILAVARFYAVTDAQMAHVAELQSKRDKLFAPKGQEGQTKVVQIQGITVKGDLNQFAKDEAARIKEARALQDKINGYLGNPTGKTGRGAKKTGKTDAQREAEQLLKSYQQMEASYREQIALVGDVTEVEKLRYELVNGEGKKFTEEQKATLLGLAAQKDAVDAANKQLEEAKSLTESLLLPFEQINKKRERAKELLDAGAISQETYNRALEAQLTPAEDMLANLALEAELLGKTREEQELLTAARYLGAEAATEQGKAALAAMQELQKQRKDTEDQIEAMDALRSAARGFLSDLREGVGVWDALKNAADDFAAALFEMAARKLVERALGADGSTNTGAAGGGFNWGALLGAFFGGGKASGGAVSPGMFYRVNEDGPEMLSVSGKDYLMMGSQAGQVTPRPAMRGGGPISIQQTWVVQGRMDARTSRQAAQDSAVANRTALARNSG